MRILGADDQQNVRGVVEGMLENAGYQVHMVSDGEALLAEFASAGADLILLDVKMPGMTGMEVCERLRSDPASLSVPVIMLSALEDEAVIMSALERGADDYILKPFSRAELVAKVRFALQRRRQAALPRFGMHPGTRFADRFEIKRELGSGGFSVVLQAHDFRLQTDVALKIFDVPRDGPRGTEFAQSFLREAYELSKLDCSGIVKFHDFGQSNTLYYLVMECLEGRSLKNHVVTEGPMAEEDVLVLIRELCRVMLYLANRDMMHGDIKPSNVMVGTDGRIKLLDFGLARPFADPPLMAGDETFLSPVYAAPEGFYEEGGVDVRSDVYSLGATAFYAATGERPYPPGDVESILAAKTAGAPPRIRTVMPDLSRGLDDLVAGMLRRDAAERPGVKGVKERVEAMLASGG